MKTHAKRHTRWLYLHDLSVMDAVYHFSEDYNRAHKNNWFRELQVIHGYGSSGQGGVIRTHIRSLMDEASIEYIPGEIYNNNWGLTVVDLMYNPLLPYIDYAQFVTRNFIDPFASHGVKKLMPLIHEYCCFKKTGDRIIKRFHGDFSVFEIETALEYLLLLKKVACKTNGGINIYLDLKEGQP